MDDASKTIQFGENAIDELSTLIINLNEEAAMEILWVRSWKLSPRPPTNTLYKFLDSSNK